MILFGIKVLGKLYDDNPNFALIRRRARMKFKAIVRRAYLNRRWLMRKSEEGKKRDTKFLLTFETRVALNKAPENRTPLDLEHIVQVLKKIIELNRYGEIDYTGLARNVRYFPVDAGRTIVKQDGTAENMFCIIYGVVEIEVQKLIPNSNVYQSFTSLLHAGSIFGDLALLLDGKRFASVSAKTNCELIVIPRDAYDILLRENMIGHYIEVRLAMNEFYYFQQLTKVQITELCFYGRVVTYPPGTVLVSKKSPSIYATFLLSGKCDLMEAVNVVRVNTLGREEKFMPTQTRKKTGSLPSLAELQIGGSSHELCSARLRLHQYQSFNQGTQRGINKMKLYALYTPLPKSSQKLRTRRRSLASKIDISRLSTSRAFTDDAVSERSERSILGIQKPRVQNTRRCRQVIREVYDAKVHNKKIKLNEFAIDNVFEEHRELPFGGIPQETHFVKIGTFSRLACFNIGESLENRAIVTTTRVKVLEIPQPILAQTKSVVWDRLSMALQKRLPTHDKVFGTFTRNRKFAKYQEKLITDVLQDCNIRTNNRIANIPYSIRLKQNYELTDMFFRMRNHAIIAAIMANPSRLHI